MNDFIKCWDLSAHFKEDQHPDMLRVNGENYIRVIHGVWLEHRDDRFGPLLNDMIECSRCGVYFSTTELLRRSYCPNCGARMDGLLMRNGERVDYGGSAD